MAKTVIRRAKWGFRRPAGWWATLGCDPDRVTLWMCDWDTCGFLRGFQVAAQAAGKDLRVLYANFGGQTSFLHIFLILAPIWVIQIAMVSFLRYLQEYIKILEVYCSILEHFVVEGDIVPTVDIELYLVDIYLRTSYMHYVGRTKTSSLGGCSLEAPLEWYVPRPPPLGKFPLWSDLRVCRAFGVFLVKGIKVLAAPVLSGHSAWVRDLRILQLDLLLT
ncbi:hypothetical protein L6452_06731 [Arctium lappa]|uniref:Uncharacterized protein n=1 Tax=Arctium lappa TaxID=4217 RepID=A0ACB9EK08_ARCLA|nr:hypothetical protein L6452_06731 [Arctium lappa]